MYKLHRLETSMPQSLSFKMSTLKQNEKKYEVEIF